MRPVTGDGRVGVSWCLRKKGLLVPSCLTKKTFLRGRAKGGRLLTGTKWAEAGKAILNS